MNVSGRGHVPALKYKSRITPTFDAGVVEMTSSYTSRTPSVSARSADRASRSASAAQHTSVTSNSMQWYSAEATSGVNTPSLSVVRRVFTNPGAGGLLNRTNEFLPSNSPPCSVRQLREDARPPRTAPQRCACVQLLSASC